MYKILQGPDTRYGNYGGVYLPELLMAQLYQLVQFYQTLMTDPGFKQEFNDQLYSYAGRPTAFTEVKRFSAAISGPRIFLKREDLLHTGAHKLNNALGQCLLARKMGKTRIIAETGAGQHGVATATACARLGLECVVYMGEVDMARQAPNVARMNLLGAQVVPVTTGSKTLKDAVNEALRDWSESFETTHYCLGSALGPYPYPQMVEQFQSVIGTETRQQCLATLQKLPDMVIACIGGGSNAIGMFSAFIDDQKVQLVGVEAGGTGKKLGQHAARFQGGRPGVLHGCYSYVLQDGNGQICPTHSISAGLDYPMIGPQHAYLHDTRRVSYVNVSDQEALAACRLLAAREGILPALESAHALAHLAKVAKTLDRDAVVVVNLSGRGDKDLPQLMAQQEVKHD